MLDILFGSLFKKKKLGKFRHFEMPKFADMVLSFIRFRFRSALPYRCQASAAHATWQRAPSLRALGEGSVSGVLS